MEAYLRRYEIPLVSSLPVTILRLEERITCLVDEFRLTGILDRVDARGGTIWIVDYKTTSSAARLAIDFDRLETDKRSSWGEAIGSLQLPFYCLLWDEADAKSRGEREAMFLLLGRAYLDQGMEVRLFTKEDDHLSAFEKAKSVILGLAREVVDPGLGFDPGLRKKKACSFCDYRYMCGTQ